MTYEEAVATRRKWSRISTCTLWLQCAGSLALTASLWCATWRLVGWIAFGVTVSLNVLAMNLWRRAWRREGELLEAKLDLELLLAVGWRKP